MPSDEMKRPPAPVLVMVVLYALLGAGALIFGVGLALMGAPALGLIGLFGLLPGAVALGLWQGNWGARAVAILFAIPSLLGVIVVVLLLVVPESSRDWFSLEKLYEDEGDDWDEGEDDGPATGAG